MWNLNAILMSASVKKTLLLRRGTKSGARQQSLLQDCRAEADTKGVCSLLRHRQYTMCVCIHIYIYIYIMYLFLSHSLSISLSLSIYIYIYTYTHIHTYAGICTYALAYGGQAAGRLRPARSAGPREGLGEGPTYIYIYIYIYIHMNIYIYIYIYSYMYIHVCIYIYILEREMCIYVYIYTYVYNNQPTTQTNITHT